jgi:hypothetical protein
MKKLLVALFVFATIDAYSYFDGGINYVVGRKGYTGRDIYLIFGRNWWIKPEYSSWENDIVNNRFEKYSLRIGFEKTAYILSFNGSYTPKKNDYNSVSGGLDITFSLNPTSSGKKRIAGPNSGFVSRSASGVAQIDLGGGVNFVLHKYTPNNTDNNLKEINTFLFAGAKVFLTQLSLNYTFYNYDNNSAAKNLFPTTQKLYSMNSYFNYFLKSNFNFKIEIPNFPMITPYILYNKLRLKTNETINVYGFGGYIDLNMVGFNISFETYKGDITSDERYNYLSVSGGIRF